MAKKGHQYTRFLYNNPYHFSMFDRTDATSFRADGGDRHGEPNKRNDHVGEDEGPTGGGGTAYWYGPTEVSPRLSELPRGSVHASDRFFIAPAETGSLVEEKRRSNAAASAAASASASASAWGAVPVDTYSKDPREDFLCSMAEMAAACCAERLEPPDYWDFMEELLFCYLELNDRSVYRHIFAAFADLTAGLSHRRLSLERRRRV